MTTQTNTAQDLNPAMADAIDWIVRLSSGEATDQEAEAFRQWHDQNDAHAQAWRMMNSIRPAGRAIAQRRDSGAPVGRRAFLSAGGVGIVAVSLVSLRQPPLGLWPSLAELMADHRTGTAQRYAFAPSSGVKVELNARTSVGLVEAGRGLNLIEGQAFVTVDRDRFNVLAGNSRIEASRAAFDVETFGGKVHLACSSGEVRCITGEQTATLSPGEQLTVSASGRVIRSEAHPADIASWRNGLLVFRGAPLGDVIARINRYRSGSIVLADRSKAMVPITAHVFTDQIEDAIPQLVQILGVPARTLPGNVVLLG